jgi:pimeloyl-ACP methyl ester carboxylesterase
MDRGKNLLRRIREHVSGWVLTGLIVAITGFTPQEWTAALFRLFPTVGIGWLSSLDIRLILVAVGVTIVVCDVLLQNRAALRRVTIGSRGSASAPEVAHPAPVAGGKSAGDLPLSPPEVGLDTSEPDVSYEQQIQFCRAPDGVRIAYSRIGQGPPLVKTGNWMTHLEFDFESPIWRHLYRELACNHTLIRYDTRGNGLSDREVENVSFEAFVHDLEAVVDAAGVERFALLGISQGCAVSIGYAVRHPERVTHLVLYGGFAVGWNKRPQSDAVREQDLAMVTLMRLGWGQENPAFRQLFTSQFMPGATKQQADWFNELQRISTSPADAVRNFNAVGEIDVRALLGKVTVPTLVMHARDDGRVPFEAGRRMAAGIAGARFVPLPGRNHLFLDSEPAFGRFLQEVRTFLAVQPAVG